MSTTDTTNTALLFAPIVVVNVLPSGSAFATRVQDGEDCYIPASVSNAVGAAVGDEFTARLVPNRYPDKAGKTPWLVVHMAKPTTPAPATVAIQYAMPFDQAEVPVQRKPVPTVAERVRAVMQDGGVWTVATLYSELFPDTTRADGLTNYNAISAAVRSMFLKGDCSKFQLWRAADQSKPSREWFTCHPDRADVDEWE